MSDGGGNLDYGYTLGLTLGLTAVAEVVTEASLNMLASVRPFLLSLPRPLWASI